MFLVFALLKSLYLFLNDLLILMISGISSKPEANGKNQVPIPRVIPIVVK